MTDTTKFEINKPLVGVIAIVALLSGAISMAMDLSANAVGASLLRVGILMSALWMALPFRRSGRPLLFPPWVIVVALGVLLFVVRRPGALIPAAVLLFVVAILVRPWRTDPVDKKRNPPRP